MGLVPEEWGGSTPMVNVSAKKGTGVDDLLQVLAWTAEEKGYVACPNKPAAGTVIEAHLDRKRGAVATLLVQVRGRQSLPRGRWGHGGMGPVQPPAAKCRIAAPPPAGPSHPDPQLCPTPTPPLPKAGTLRVGDLVVAGASSGKVRSLSNAAGSSTPEAGPSIAVQMVGLNNVPQAGERSVQGRGGPPLIRPAVCSSCRCRGPHTLSAH
jgi:hypothetical protein